MTYGRGREFKKLPPLTLDTIKDGQYVANRLTQEAE